MRPSTRKKLLPIFLYVAFGLIFGILFTTTLDLSNNTDAKKEEVTSLQEDLAKLQNIQSCFTEISQQVGSAVVSVSTVYTQKVGISRDFFEGPFGQDEFFDRFFKDFFGELPERKYKQMGLGSGVIIDKKGYILTNEHVVGEADEITVTLSDGREFKGEVTGTDPRSDLAVIKIDAENLPVAKLGNSDKISIGQWAIAIGNPFGFYIKNPEPTITVGVISALHRQLPQMQVRNRLYTDLIQTDAAINPGNSGGPLVNLDGEVIGINVAIVSSTGGYQGVGFAIPINTARRRLKSLIAGEEIEYGWLGVTVQNLTADLAEYFKLKNQQGVLVAKVLEDSPAAKGGLKEADIIKKIDGEEIENVRELVTLISQTKVDKQVEIEVLRDGKTQILNVKIGKHPEDLTAVSRKGEAIWEQITVKNVTSQIAEQLQVPEGKGVVVSNIKRESLAYLAGLRVKDVIYSVNKKKVDSVEEFKAITDAIKKQESVLIRTNRGYIIIKNHD